MGAVPRHERAAYPWQWRQPPGTPQVKLGSTALLPRNLSGVLAPILGYLQM